MTKIDVFSGFLGAGKTTLIKKLLKEGYDGEKLVLIENEFGEIGIDGGFMKDAGIEVTEMNQGCICCSLVGDFGKALQKVLDEYSPDRIIIEPSGVGKLSDVIKAVMDVKSDEIVLNSYTTVCDASKIKMYMKNFGEFYKNQVETAKTIVLSRTQKLSEEKLAEAVAMIKELNDHATIVTTSWDEISGKQILAAMENENKFAEDLLKEELEHHHHHDDDEECHCHDHDHEHHHHHDDDEECHCHDHDHEHHHHHDDDEECHCHDHDHEHHHHHDDDEECHCHDHDHEHHHHHHHADEVFTSFGVETAKKFTKEGLEAALAKLSGEEYGTVLRAKGIVAGENGWFEFDFVPEEYEIRTGSPDVTGKMCVIGSKLDEDKIKALFGV